MTKDVLEFLSQTQLNYDIARTNMVKQQIRTWDVLNPQILKLFSQIPRENFVPDKYHSLAFADIAIPLPHGQAMMTPKEEARILQELNIKSTDKILILGIDSGFLITLLSCLGQQVYYLDNELESFERVKEKILHYKLTNVIPMIGNIYQSWHELLPFNVIVLTGSLPSVPEELKNALTINGRLFVVIGKEPIMEAMLFIRLSETAWSERKIFETNRPRLLDVKDPDLFFF